MFENYHDKCCGVLSLSSYLVVKHSQFCVLCAAAAAAAANAVKSVPEAPSLPSPPSLPNPTEALKSTSDVASKLSLPEAPSVISVGQDSRALQQVKSLFCMSLISQCRCKFEAFKALLSEC